jgi:hypothetical protein
MLRDSSSTVGTQQQQAGRDVGSHVHTLLTGSSSNNNNSSSSSNLQQQLLLFLHSSHAVAADGCVHLGTAHQVKHPPAGVWQKCIIRCPLA